MILKRFYDDKLAQASWLVGCSGHALVVDPARDVEQYLRAAQEEKVRITHVTETHIHADFVSGARELAERTGARLLLSGEGGADWSYGYDATLLHDGDEIAVGGMRVRVMHTPGHTPEHLSFIVTDDGADAPMGVFTGDFIFVGDVGRPDLLERAANVAGTMEAGARTLFRSLRRFVDEVPDFVQLWPGHGAGSACGKALSAIPTSTLGYEKRFNWALRHADEDAFAAEVLAGQPEPPMYFGQMKRINRDGPPLLGAARRPPRLSAGKVDELLAEGATLVDTRPAAEWARQHIPGTLSVPLGKTFATWAGSVLPYEQPFFLVVEEAHAAEAVRALAAIGLDEPGGYATPDVVDAWAQRHKAAGTLPRITQDDADERRVRGVVEIVDVRNGSEWAAGHIPGSRNVPLGRLAERISELPRDRPLVVHCQSGARAGVAISLLRARGFTDVQHLEGDWAEWARSGRPSSVRADETQPAG